MTISMKQVCEYMAIFFNISLTLSHLHPLQVENCDSNSRLVVDEDDNGKFRPEKVKPLSTTKVVFNQFYVAVQIEDIGNEMSVLTSRFANIWSRT